MVSISSMVSIIITLCICTVLPVGLYVWYGIRNRGKGVWLAWAIGAAGFVVFQLIIRIPVLSIIQLLPGFADFVSCNYVLYLTILAATAAGFELAGRYAAARILKQLTYQKSVAAGLGHGGIEAILLIGMTYVNNIIYAVMINTGVYDKVVEQTAATGVPEATVKALWDVKEALLTTEWSVFLLAGYERILTMTIHVGVTVLLYYCISRGRTAVGLIASFVIHGATDFVSALLSGLATPYMGNVVSTGTSYVFVYIFLTVMAAVMATVVVLTGKMWRKGKV